MALRWQVLRVELVMGRGEYYDPPPGRTLLIPPRTTFEELAEAIDLAFARWDRAHLCRFTLGDGTVVSDDETIRNVQSGYRGQVGAVLPLTAILGRRLKVGQRLTYVFDFGDDWTHLITVEPTVDPVEAYGVHPDGIVPIWGWGAIPDQYGRRWRDDDGDPDAQPPARPDIREAIHGRRGPSEPAPRLTADEVRAARETPAALIELMTGKELGDVVQQVAVRLLRGYAAANAKGRDQLKPLLLHVYYKAKERGWAGDEELADELLATLRGQAPQGEPLAVDLVDLADEAHFTGQDGMAGAYVDTATGETRPAAIEAWDDEDDEDSEERDEIFVEDDANDWNDLDAFADAIDGVDDNRVADQIRRAIEGRGAFSRFRVVVDEHRLTERWYGFRDDRRAGRMRLELLRQGYRPIGAVTRPDD